MRRRINCAFVIALLCSQPLCAKHKTLPEVYDVGSYTLSVTLGEGWRVNVVPKVHSAAFSFVDILDARNGVSEILVSQIQIDVEVRSRPSSEVSDWIVANSYRLIEKRLPIRKLKWWKGDGAGFSVQSGECHLYSFRKGMHPGYFYYMAAIVPPDFEQRGVGYVVFFHETGRGTADGARQLDVFTKIVESLKEKKGEPGATDNPGGAQ